MLRIAIHVQRAEGVERPAFGKILLERAVGRRRGCVHEAPPSVQSKMRQNLREFKIIADQVAGVCLGGRRAGAQVKNRGDIVKLGRRGEHPALEIVALEVIRKLERNQVLPLVISAQKVAYQDVGVTAAVQLPDQGAADEPCTPRDQYSAFCQINHISTKLSIHQRSEVRRQKSGVSVASGAAGWNRV